MIIFFGMSGYTIAWVCDKRSKGNGLTGLVHFAYDRFMRLSIPLLPLLLVSLLAESLLLGSSHPHPGALSLRSFVGNVLYLQWLTPEIGPLAISLGVQPFGLNRPLWTLALEFWTYIAFAGAFFSLSGSWARWICLACAFVAVTLLGNAFYAGQGNGLPLVWLAGSALYFALSKVRFGAFWRWSAAAVAVLLCVLLSLNSSLWPADGGYTKLYNFLTFMTFALAVVAAGGLQEIGKRSAGFFGGFAYSTYITHYPLQYLLLNSGFVPRGEIGVLAATFICVAVGWAWGRIFEAHYKHIRSAVWSGLGALIPARRVAE